MRRAQPVKILELGSSSTIKSPSEFNEKVGKHRVPVVIRGEDVGTCVSKWTVDYLVDISPEKKVKVHRSKGPQLDFRNKNFSYETIRFKELVTFCSEEKVPQAAEENTKILDSGENDEYYWYLRSLGEDPRGKDVSDLSEHFPELFKDLRIPNYFPEESFFSSVFRITSPLLQLWTHYDTCDNILIQIRGRKRIVFFPPTEALNLYLDGDKSQVLDVDSPNLKLYPDFGKAERYEAFLEEGDIVFIPALWFHNVTALEFSISVNVFWKNLDLSLYDKKDTYGNRDLIPAQLANKTFEKATAQLKVLPKEYEDFYLRRMIVSIQKRLADLNKKDSEF